MKQTFIVITIIAWMGSSLLAHTGHHERVMGTVLTIKDARLEVKTTTGKTLDIVLNDKTRILKAAQALKRADIHEGDRVVVTAMSMKGSDGKTMLMAEEVRLGSAPVTKTKIKR